jgi:hypothetical protein
MADVSPDAAITNLRSLVDLYGEGASLADRHTDLSGVIGSRQARDAADERVSLVVALAERKLAELKLALTKEREVQLATLEERLKTAQRLSSKDPGRATAMYRAIIDLHEHDAWAERIVVEARQRLLDVDH